MVVSRETVGLSNIVRKFLPPFVHTVWETLKYRNVWHLRSLARCNFQETKTPFIKPIEIKYIKSWVFKVHRGNDNSYRLLITRQLLFIDNNKYNKRWYNGCRQESYRCPFPHSPHTLTCTIRYFPNFCIIFWFGLQLEHTYHSDCLEIGKRLRFLSSQSIEVVLSLFLRGLTVICRLKWNKMKKCYLWD